MESVPSGDLVGQSRRVRVVLVGMDLHVEGVGHDLAVLGQALGGQAGQDGPEGEEDGIGTGQEVDSAIMLTPHRGLIEVTTAAAGLTSDLWSVKAPRQTGSGVRCSFDGRRRS